MNMESVEREVVYDYVSMRGEPQEEKNALILLVGMIVFAGKMEGRLPLQLLG